MKLKLYHAVIGFGEAGQEISVNQQDGCRLVSTGCAAVIEQVEEHEREAHAANAPAITGKTPDRKPSNP